MYFNPVSRFYFRFQVEDFWCIGYTFALVFTLNSWDWISFLIYTGTSEYLFVFKDILD
jgi:hypothetical protein